MGIYKRGLEKESWIGELDALNIDAFVCTEVFLFNRCYKLLENTLLKQKYASSAAFAQTIKNNLIIWATSASATEKGIMWNDFLFNKLTVLKHLDYKKINDNT